MNVTAKVNNLSNASFIIPDSPSPQTTGLASHDMVKIKVSRPSINVTGIIDSQYIQYFLLNGHCQNIKKGKQKAYHKTFVNKNQ